MKEHQQEHQQEYQREHDLSGVGSIQLLGLFRLILAILLSSFYLADKRLWPLDPALSTYFQTCLGLYLIFLLVSTLVWRNPKFHNNISVTLFSLIDLCLLSTLCAYTGGIDSPLLFLILVSIMIHGSMMSLFYGFLLVLTSIVIMVCFWLADNSQILESNNIWRDIFLEQGILKISAQSVMAFAAIMMANTWRKRIAQGNFLVLLQQQAIIEATALHEAIVQQYKNGIIVVNKSYYVHLVNDIAKTFFIDETHETNKTHKKLITKLQSFPETLLLKTLSLDLYNKLQHWLNMRSTDMIPLIVNDKTYYVTFSQIQANNSFNIVITLESEENINQRVQQEKLAALGQLTAGIAHEIRNPLAAISQASQLLTEQLDNANLPSKLSLMINKNVFRANKIINDILDLARRQNPQIVIFEIYPWLKSLIEEFQNNYPNMKNMKSMKNMKKEGKEDFINLNVDIKDKNISFVAFDPGHLRQIIWNLLSNSVFHFQAEKHSEQLEINISVDGNSTYNWISIHDNGIGISPEKVEHLFEPFFSTHSQGTGLGLYLAREMCEANRATIEYVVDKGAKFLIRFHSVKNLNLNHEN